MWRRPQPVRVNWLRLARPQSGAGCPLLAARPLARPPATSSRPFATDHKQCVRFEARAKTAPRPRAQPARRPSCSRMDAAENPFGSPTRCTHLVLGARAQAQRELLQQTRETSSAMRWCKGCICHRQSASTDQCNALPTCPLAGRPLVRVRLSSRNSRPRLPHWGAPAARRPIQHSGKRREPVNPTGLALQPAQSWRQPQSAARCPYKRRSLSLFARKTLLYFSQVLRHSSRSLQGASFLL